MLFNSNILNPAWVTGFIDGEGTFFVGIQPKSDMTTGYQVSLQFVISQHIRDIALMELFPQFFMCGYVIVGSANICQFRIRNIVDLETHLFPLLDAYPLLTQKSLDAAAFREVHALMAQKQHLTFDGIQQIRKIKDSMNRGRMLNYK